MSTFFYVFGDLLGAVNGRSVAFLFGVVGLLFATLALFGSLFLLGSPVSTAHESVPLVPQGDVLVELSPSLSSSAINALYLQLRDRSDVAAINYRLPEELGSEQGAFLVHPVSGTTQQLVEAVSAIPGVVKVDAPTPPTPSKGPFALSAGVKIGLLVGLVVCLVASLILGRLAFRRVLAGFAGEIRMMRLSGTEERTILPPIVALGVVCGILAGVLLVVVVVILHYVATTQPGALLHAASGLVSSGRVSVVSVVGFLLGALLGGLIGALGASLTQSREFQVYS
jgi:hypothetical protein